MPESLPPNLDRLHAADEHRRGPSAVDSRSATDTTSTTGITGGSLTIQAERRRILRFVQHEMRIMYMPGDETWGMLEIALFLASAVCIFGAAAMAVAG